MFLKEITNHCGRFTTKTKRLVYDTKWKLVMWENCGVVVRALDSRVT